jgi:hypothetical protein
MRLDADRGEPPRSGRLTEAQRNELTGLAVDPLLLQELRTTPGRCEVSDGPEERLEVGEVHYLANWCRADRPRIEHLRERITTFTTGR